MMRISLVCMTLALAACAGPNPPSNARKLQLTDGVIALMKSDEEITLADPRIRCDQRQLVGSNFRTRICMLQAEYDAERESNMRDNFGASHSAGTGMGGRFDNN